MDHDFIYSLFKVIQNVEHFIFKKPSSGAIMACWGNYGNHKEIVSVFSVNMAGNKRNRYL